MARSRPLPGIRFEAEVPSADGLPRMDVPVFAGFAASGPLHRPVAVEDAVQFETLFGARLPLARESSSGAPVEAYLAPAVRAFFKNGGRRCWIIRLARNAQANRFRIPGLEILADDGTLSPAYGVARSEGSWSDGLRVVTNLVGAPLRLMAFDAGNLSVDVIPSTPREVAPGELLRLTWPGGSFPRLFLFVQQVSALPLSSPPAPRGSVRISGRTRWVPAPPPDVSALPGRPVVERLVFDLTVRRPGELPVRLAGLGFTPDHPRYWADLPSDAELFGEPALAPSALRTEASRPRFPLAAEGRGGLFLPTGMDVLFSREQAAEPVSGPALERDGLKSFEAGLFLDPGLRSATVRDLLDQADFIRYQSSDARPLEGIHAALGVEEATMIAVPDAVHRGWSLETPRPSLPASPPSSPLASPQGGFEDCNPAPRGEPAGPGTVPAIPPAAPQWVSVPADGYDDSLLVEVHEALLTMCAARGDLFALLSLPRHYDERQAISHPAQLRAAPHVRGYGALWHPWLILRDPETAPLQATPPDGATAGVLAARALARGAWIAPANEPLRGPVALTPLIAAPMRQALQDAAVNVIRQEPWGFVCLDADTLSPDEEVRPVNVRRLLALLRRAAQKVGNDYVFEPNDDAARRAVKRAFQSMLETLFVRGAFAGRTAASAFQVVTGESLNPRRSIDVGRLIAEIRVAPSRPLSFLTIRLVEDAGATRVLEARP